jgi:hypothetical protein
MPRMRQANAQLLARWSTEILRPSIRAHAPGAAHDGLADALLRDALRCGGQWLRNPADTTRRGMRRAVGFARAAVLFRRYECGEFVAALGGRVRVVADGRSVSAIA